MQSFFVCQLVVQIQQDNVNARMSIMKLKKYVFTAEIQFLIVKLAKIALNVKNVLII